MATSIDKTKVATGEEDLFLLCWARGDNDPRTFTLRDSLGVAIDISTWTLTMAVSTEKDPTDTAAQIFQVAGIQPGGGTDGVVTFTPPANSLDTVSAGLKAFYDIQRTAPNIKTLIKGNVQFVMDIDKSI
jgi:hypothetical protein